MVYVCPTHQERFEGWCGNRKEEEERTMAARLSTCMGLVFNFTLSWKLVELFSIIILSRMFIYNMHHGLIIIYILHTHYKCGVWFDRLFVGLTSKDPLKV